MEFDVFPVVLLPTFHQVLDQIDSVVDDILSEGFGWSLTSEWHDEWFEWNDQLFILNESNEPQVGQC